MTIEPDSGHHLGKPDAGRKARRLVLAFVIGLGLAGATLVILFVARAAIVEAVLANRLRALGLDRVALSVEDVAPQRTRIAAVTIGRGGELRIDRLDVTYALGELLRGDVRRVEIDGLRLRATASAEGVSLGSLDALLTPGDGDPDAIRLPSIRLRDGRIEVTTPAGPVAIAIDGTLDGSAGGAIAANLDIAFDSPYGDATGVLATTRDAAGTIAGSYVIDRGQLRLPGTRVEGLAGGIEFALDPTGRLETVVSRFEIPDTTLGPIGLGAAEIQAGFDKGRATLDAKLEDTESGLDATVHAAIDDVFAASPATLAVDGRVSAESAIWRLLDLPTPDSGAARVTFTAAGTTPSLAALPDDLSAGLDVLAALGLTGRLALRIEDVAYAAFLSGLDAALDMDIAFDANGIAVTLPAKGLVEVAQVTPALLQAAGIPDDAIAGLGGPLSLELGGIADTPFRLTFSPDRIASGIGLDGAATLRLADGGTIAVEAGGTLDLDGGDTAPLFDLPRFALRLKNLSVMGHRLDEARASGRLGGTAPDDVEGAVDLSLAVPQYATDEIRLSDIRLDAPVQFRLAGKRIVLWIGEAGTLDVARIAADRRLQIDKPLRLTFAGQTRPVLDLTLAPGNRTSFSHYVKVRTGDIAGRVPRDDGKPVSFTLRPLTLRLNGGQAARRGYRTTVELSGDGFALPGFDLAAGEIGASMVVGVAGDGPVGRFGIRNLRHLGDPAAVAPLHITGTAERRGDKLIFTVDGADATGVRRIAVTGSHAPASAAGEARIALTPVTFAPDGLQPQALFPGLVDLRSVSGSAAASAHLRWDADGINGTAELNLDDLSFTQSDTQVEGLSAAVRFDSLIPLVTPPGQTISARRIDPAVPLTDVALDFQIDAGGTGGRGRIRVEYVEAGFAGGLIALEDTVIEPEAARHAAAFAMSGLDLEQILRVIDVDGLGGSGTLSGTIPVAIAGDSVTVENGVLTADGKGVIRYRSEQAKKALAGGGESVDLMLRALQNFHYDELSVTLDKGVVGEARIGLRILGRNPDVLDGHPFRFNINLTGNLDKVLAVVLEGYRASNRLLGRTLLQQ